MRSDCEQIASLFEGALKVSPQTPSKRVTRALYLTSYVSFKVVVGAYNVLMSKNCVEKVNGAKVDERKMRELADT